MVQYSLTINIDDYWVEYYNNHEWEFCFARKVVSNNDKQTMNIIAYAHTVVKEVKIEWEDKYMMAASRTGYSPGDKIQITTDPLTVNYGEKFTLPANWLNPTVENDSDVPDNGFGFYAIPRAAGVLHQRVNNEMKPVYVTPGPPNPRLANETFVPQIDVALWFQRDVATGYMTDVAKQTPFIISMTTTDMMAKYDREGTWTVYSKKVDYTRGKYDVWLAKQGKELPVRSSPQTASPNDNAQKGSALNSSGTQE